MHILFVTGEYPPMAGGVGAYTAELGAALAALGQRVSVVTTQHAARQEAAPAKFQAIEVHAVIERWGRRMLSDIYDLASQLQADWVHVQYQTAAYGMNPTINVAPALWQRRHQIAWTYHDLLPPYLFPKAGRHLRRWMTELPARLSNLTIVTNEGDRQQLAGKGITAVAIPIGSNILGVTHTSDERQMRRRKRRFAHDDFVIGYFGFLNRSKGAATVIRTLQRLVQAKHNAHVFMIGDLFGASDPTNQAYFAEIEQMIIDLALVDRVHWSGREDEAEVSADLGACDALLMPYEDGASLRRGTLMAGLANGCVIVTTRPQAPLPELVEGRDLLYIAPGDDQAAAEALLRIMNDRPLAHSLRAQARQSSQQFSWAAIAQRHLQQYYFNPAS